MLKLLTLTLSTVLAAGCIDHRLDQARAQVAEVVAKHQSPKQDNGAFGRPETMPKADDGAYEFEMDPWGKPIRLYFERSDATETMTARSAGPDGVYLNTDDLYQSAKTQVASPIDRALETMSEKSKEVLSGVIEKVQEKLNEDKEQQAMPQTP